MKNTVEKSHKSGYNISICIDLTLDKIPYTYLPTIISIASVFIQMFSQTNSYSG